MCTPTAEVFLKIKSAYYQTDQEIAKLYGWEEDENGYISKEVAA